MIRLTWHPVEEPPAAAIIGLQELTVCGPVHVCDEAAGANALSDLLVPLHHTVNIHRIIIRTNSQVGPIRGILQLMDCLLPVFDVDHLCHISGGNKSLNEELK